ncbi:MAG: hypothetical protein ABWU84_04020 [Pyrobaculum sp.]|uniref:hypothetical protein n=1 Tax=Pyrobaculum sp. TaxID=2004705 RepID=UPI003EE9E771
MLVALEGRLRATLWRLAREFAYLALLGTSYIPPCSLLRRRVARVVEPEFISFMAARIGGDVPDVYLNSALGMRLGGVPRCEILHDISPELYQLCNAIRTRGYVPLYKAVHEVVVPLALSASVAGLEEGDILLASYRAAAGKGDLSAVLRYFDRWVAIGKFF